MDIQEILNSYLEIANELGNNSAKSLINDFIEKNSKQRYELPLIGQFSSGKSATINHLLGRDLLPTKSIRKQSMQRLRLLMEVLKIFPLKKSNSWIITG